MGDRNNSLPGSTLLREDSGAAAAPPVSSANFQLRGKAMTADGFVQTISSILNGSSLGLYRVTEHAHKRVPDVLEETRTLDMLSDRICTCLSGLRDAQLVVRGLTVAPELARISDIAEKAVRSAGDIKRRRAAQ